MYCRADESASAVEWQYELPMRKELKKLPGQMKTIEDVHKYAAEQGIVEEEALKQGMEAKSKEFAEKEAEVYTKA
jgi:hypothetical protein